GGEDEGADERRHRAERGAAHHEHSIGAPAPLTQPSNRTGGLPRPIVKRTSFPIEPGRATRTSRITPGRRAWCSERSERRLTTRPAEGQPGPMQRSRIWEPAGAVTLRRSTTTPCRVTWPRRRTTGNGIIGRRPSCAGSSALEDAFAALAAAPCAGAATTSVDSAIPTPPSPSVPRKRTTC